MLAAVMAKMQSTIPCTFADVQAALQRVARIPAQIAERRAKYLAANDIAIATKSEKKEAKAREEMRELDLEIQRLSVQNVNEMRTNYLEIADPVFVAEKKAITVELVRAMKHVGALQERLARVEHDHRRVAALNVSPEPVSLLPIPETLTDFTVAAYAERVARALNPPARVAED